MPRPSYRFNDLGEIYELWDETALAMAARDEALTQYDKNISPLAINLSRFEKALAEGNEIGAQHAWKAVATHIQELLDIRNAVAQRRQVD